MEEKVMRLMRKGAITCGADATIREVAQIMMVNDIRYCVVINEAHEVLGIISPRRILAAFDRDLDATHARDILHPYSFTVTPGSPLKEAIQLMDKKKIEHLIVASDRPGSSAILGMLHVEDIVERMASNTGGGY
jgi:predicted transcriptional regulator